MNSDEIKEIISYLKNNTFIPDETKRKYKILHRDEVNKLLDYITNLQEQLHQASLDIQELTERDIECPSWCDKLTNLQQENERLRRQNFNLIEYRDSLIDENREQREDLFDYKSRVEKAIEYIGVPLDNYWEEESKYLLNILQGCEDK